MALHPCVKSVLRTLTGPALRSLRSLITANISTLQVLKAQLQTRLTKLQVQLVPIAAGRDAALAVLEQSRGVASILPLDVIRDCTDLGDLNAQMAEGIGQATAAVQDFADDATRLLTIKANLTAEIAKLDTLITRLNEWVAAIDDVLAGG